MVNCFNINELSMDIGSLAVQSIMYEVTCYPSPGLVSINSNGAHSDMNYYTFIDSTAALLKYLMLIAQTGYSARSSKEIFKKTREIGVIAEKDMLVKTRGVNTHKGMLFVTGICACAFTKLIFEHKKFSRFTDIIKDMSSGIVKSELNSISNINNTKLTHGEELFIKYNTTGVRGEIEKGLPIIFDFSKDFYKNSYELSQNDRLVHTLIGIMQYLEDSNIIYRHSPEILKEVQKKSRYIISIGGMKTIKGRKAIEKLNDYFIKRRISPGGSADILSATVFVSLLEDYFNKNIQKQG